MYAAEKTRKIGKPRMERMALVRGVLMGFKHVLDEELEPLGITTAQLRVLWVVDENPSVSGAEVARLCAVTPQSGHALLAGLEEHGWVRRRASAASERVRVAEVTARGRRVLASAQRMAEALDRRIWKGIGERELRVLDEALGVAVEKLRVQGAGSRVQGSGSRAQGPGSRVRKAVGGGS